MQKFELTGDHRRWASSRARSKRYRRPKQFWLDLIEKQRGLCAFSHVPLLFGSADGTPIKGSHSQHPVYAVVDHISPGSDSRGYMIVSNDLNDLKGHLNLKLFGALRRTAAWKRLMRRWRGQAESDHRNRNAFRAIRRGEG